MAVALSRKAKSAPVDFAPLARSRRVRLVHLRNIIPDGVTRPTSGGFEIFLRDAHDRTVVLDEQPLPRLGYRQRFTLAHELAHTFYYDIEATDPKLLPRLPARRDLETFCDAAASIVLLPEHLFVPEIHGRAITMKLVRGLSRKFLASAAAILRRVKALHRPGSEDSALLRVRSSDHVIEVAYVPPRILPLLPYPVEFKTKATAWCRGAVPRDFYACADGSLQTAIRGVGVTFRKVSSLTYGCYYLEVTPEE